MCVFQPIITNTIPANQLQEVFFRQLVIKSVFQSVTDGVLQPIIGRGGTVCGDVGVVGSAVTFAIHIHEFETSIERRCVFVWFLG